MSWCLSFVICIMGVNELIYMKCLNSAWCGKLGGHLGGTAGFRGPGAVGKGGWEYSLGMVFSGSSGDPAGLWVLGTVRAARSQETVIL